MVGLETFFVFRWVLYKVSTHELCMRTGQLKVKCNKTLTRRNNKILT